MPKRTDISSILIIGAGPIVIGQACEFDYSGTQACKALKAEGYRVILVNSNPATIMTDPDLADATYIEPITPEIVAKIIAKERPDALLADHGRADRAQHRAVAAPHGRPGQIRRHHDRRHRRRDRQGRRSQAVSRGDDQDRSGDAALASVKTLIEALEALDDIGLPAIIRPSFTLGGTGGGIAYNKAEFIEIVERGIDASPTSEVLIEESVLGWKEFEMEVVRDKNDNCIIVCSIENLDPMGVHTGDSITVAPALTLTDKEYQLHARRLDRGTARDRRRDRRLQRAVRRQSRRRPHRRHRDESAGVALLGAGLEGDRLSDRQGRGQAGGRLHARRAPERHHRRATPASFEPTIDYVVTKMPRFAFEKFPGAEPLLTTSMKSVGEAMAIGRTFQESLQKASRKL